MKVLCGLLVKIMQVNLSFGKNNFGQLGTGNKTDFNDPQKLQDISPVLSVSCGYEHTLIITNDDNLRSCGKKEYGQLCHGDKEHTLFSNISKISAGYYHSLFQNDKEELFACGYNQQGACGLGHKQHPQIIPISFLIYLQTLLILFVEIQTGCIEQ